MRLITPPEENTDWNRHNNTSKFYQCVIVCPDNDTDHNVVWNRLKHGLVNDLELRKRVEVIDFPEDRIKLYGVMPIHMERSALWNGRVFDCKIEYFEKY